MYDDSFKIRYNRAPVAISENRDGTDTPSHIHAEIELLYIVSGEWRVCVADRKYDVGQGDMVIVDPMDVHSLVRLSSVGASTLCICVDPLLLADANLASELISGDKTVEGYLSGSDACVSEIADYFHKLYSAVEDNLETLRLEAGAYLSLIFSRLLRLGRIVSRSSRSKKESFSSKLLDYLSKHYMENITSEDVAQDLFYTQSYFCRLFKKQFGTSFLEYLSMYRISLAKAMLENPAIKIAEVAEAVGFMDSAYFSRCFKRLVGISPSEYKKYQYSY